jgi:hypothetical protein
MLSVGPLGVLGGKWPTGANVAAQVGRPGQARTLPPGEGTPAAQPAFLPLPPWVIPEIIPLA